MISIGIDEAGRGPVLGPMVVAAVGLSNIAEKKLKRLGVTDSKAFGAGEKAISTRKDLARNIGEIAEFVALRVASVATIDCRVALHQLNQLEQEMAMSLVEGRQEAQVIFDGKLVFGGLASTMKNAVAENKAEEKYISVAAASIVAKSHRDALFSLIAQRYFHAYGELRGGGYGNKATSDFLSKYVDDHGRLPPEARKSWPHNYLPDVFRQMLRKNWRCSELGLAF